MWTDRCGTVKPALPRPDVGWLGGPVVLMLTTALVLVLVLVAMWRRQFASDALHAVSGEAEEPGR